MKQVALLLIIFLICSCKQNSKDTESLHGKIGTAEELRKAIKESGNDANQIFEPIRANISELEAEINNGGFNQYFSILQVRTVLKHLRHSKKKTMNTVYFLPIY